MNKDVIRFVFTASELNQGYISFGNHLIHRTIYVEKRSLYTFNNIWLIINSICMVYFVNKLLETKFFWSDRITYLVYTCMYTRIRAYILSYMYYPIQMFFYFVDLHYLPVISMIRCTPCYGSQTTSLLYVFDWSQIQSVKKRKPDPDYLMCGGSCKWQY